MLKKQSGIVINTLMAVGALLLLCSCGKEVKHNAELLTLAYDEAKSANWDKARVLARTATEQDPRDVTALTMYALCLENCGNPEEAQQALRQAIKIEPDNFRVQYNLGRILFLHGRYEDCVNHLRAAEKLKPDDVNTLLLLAQVEEKLKLLSAADIYNKLARSPRFVNRPGPWNQMAVAYAEHGNNLSALKCFMQAYKHGGDSYIVALNFAVFLDYYLNSVDSRKRAVQFYRQYLRLTANNPEMQARRDEVSDRIRALARVNP